MLRPELRKILNIIADKAENNINKSLIDLAVIQEGGLSEFEARKYINELQGRQLITIDPRVSGTDID